jgi:hypothetical protein
MKRLRTRWSQRRETRRRERKEYDYRIFEEHRAAEKADPGVQSGPTGPGGAPTGPF